MFIQIMESCKKNVLFFYYGVFMFFSFQISDVFSATDTISTSQPLSGLQTIVSSSNIFELGLFNADSLSGNYGFYLGIWYKQVSARTIVWVANRDYRSSMDNGNQELRSSDYFLNISNGNLVLYQNFAGEIWSTGVKSSRSKDVRAVLLDNGNLVLRDGPASSAAVLWQSFDHPTDTWLPGAKLKLGSTVLTSWNNLTDPSSGQYTVEVGHDTNNPLITVWNRSKIYWSSGPWENGLQQFKGLPSWGANFSFHLNVSESYITYSTDQGLTCLVIDVLGRFMPRYQSYSHKTWTGKLSQSDQSYSHKTWTGKLSQSDQSYSHKTWTVKLSQSEKKCAVPNNCGSFGVCSETDDQPCRCVQGFKKAIDEKSGCKRETKLQCGKGNTKFIRMENMNLATDPTKTLNFTAVTAPQRCASGCLTDCSCEAYATDGNKCLMWTKDVFNLEQLKGDIGHPFFLKVADSKQGKGKLPKGIVLAAVLSALVAAGVLYLIAPKRKNRTTQRNENHSRELLVGGIIDGIGGEHMRSLNLHDIMMATNIFSEENKLGEGGFGPVYRGTLRNGTDVAIKRLSKKSTQGLTEFKNEVILIIKLQHKNLVRLLGYCVEDDEKLLVYEYMSNKSLDLILFDPERGRGLDWETRMKIINGTTRGLQYLHEYSRLRIIHRDLKPSNILLDNEMNPKISDFGTARIFGCNQVDDSTQKIVGTFGYMSPEYAISGTISEKSDIYSFGVLLLEIISGKKATRFSQIDHNHSLISFAWESWCQTKGESIIDEALSGSYSVKEVRACVHIALLCVQDHPKDRPTISEVVYMLSNDSNLPMPKQPTFSNILSGNPQLMSSDYEFSINEATQTEIEAR